MELTDDYGHAGFGEDIEIDLDFPTGQPDEDMDLGDFDQAHEAHNFNSDTRDELMAEGDDLSYNMLDAIETDHNALAAAANDIDLDLDLEHKVESIWEQGPAHSNDFNLDVEIDYLDEATTEVMDAERNDAETNEWVPSINSQNANATIDHVGEVSTVVLAEAQDPHEEVILEVSVPSHEETSGPLELSHPLAEDSSSAAPNLVEEERLGDVKDVPEDEINEKVAQEPEEPSVIEQAEQTEQGISESTTDIDVEPHGQNIDSLELDEQQGTSRFEETDQVPSDTNWTHVSQGLGQPEHTGSLEPSGVNGDHADPSQYEGADDEPTDNASEYQLGGEPYVETTNDQTGVHDSGDDDAAAATATAAEATSFAPDRSHSRSAQTTPAPDLRDPQIDAAPFAGVSDRDDPVELADRYGVYISYGETNYRLFAKSEDDDPNEYFLNDQSVLDIPLSQFLARLREVITEEVSPLDELVMELDGLGLDFSESTTPEFLEKFTFGDLVVLYDKLVKNEPTESPLPIYTYLTVKPNCTRRMMALGESANAGRGLSEVAMYHDSPINEDQVNDMGSPDTELSTGDYNNNDNSNIYPQEDHGEGEDEVDPAFDDRPQDILSMNDGFQPDDEVDELDDTEIDGDLSKQDNPTNEPSELQSQENGERWNEPSSKTSEVGEPKSPAPQTAPVNSSIDVSSSENTSVTATLDGEDHDEIDYNSDEDDVNDFKNVDKLGIQTQQTETRSDLTPPDDEITWESEDEEEEEAKIETNGGLAKDTVQVSPVSGKRTRSDSEALNGADDENDHKRRRS